MDLLPCPFCGSGHVLGDGEADDSWFECMNCNARGPRTVYGDAMDIDASKDAWNRRGPDPALLALARFGARIANDYHRGKYGFVSADGDWLDIDAASAGVKEYQGAADLAPGIADAIARLLAPAGAASEGVAP